MTKKQLLNALESNDYLALRTYTGNVIGINCGIKNTGKILATKHLKGQSTFMSFRRITFMEYISIKVPFCGVN